MKVTITQQPDSFYCYQAARLCKGIFVNGKTEQDKIEKTLRYCFERGHWSIFEHTNISFVVEGLDRNTSHQLVRHRIASYAQESLRATELTRDKLPVPHRLKDKNKKKVKELFNKAFDLYQELLQDEPKELARMVLPTATTSSIYVTMNFRAFMEFYHKRQCNTAQKEIRDIVLAVKDQRLEPVFNNILNFCGCDICNRIVKECEGYK